MIFIAGLNAIPTEQYEAASVDGQTGLQNIYVTMPGLINTFKVCTYDNLIQAMKLFTQPYIMTRGGPRNATKTLVFYIYEQNFQRTSVMPAV